MSDRPSTAREFESPPAMVQPPGPSVPDPVTGSSNVTRISLTEVARAPATAGFCPSASVRFLGPTNSPLGSISNQPVAEEVASGASKWITCSRVPPPAYPSDSTVRFVPPTCSVPYSSWTASASKSTVTLRGPVTFDETTDTGLSSRIGPATCPSPRRFGGAAWSSTADAFIVTFPREPRGTAASPASVSVCTAVPLPAAPWTRRTGPAASETLAYASLGAFTGSLYVTITVLSPVRLAFSMRGAIPSDTPSDRTGGSALPDASATGLPAASYDSSMPDGLSSGRLPLSLSATTFDPSAMASLVATARSRASPPATDQPPAPVPSPASASTTGSLSTMRTVSRTPSDSTAAAPTTEGCCPSATCRVRLVLPSIWLFCASVIRVPSIVSVPVVFAASPPPKRITCLAVPLPSTPVTTLLPPGDNAMPPLKAARVAFTGSV